MKLTHIIIATAVSAAPRTIQPQQICGVRLPLCPANQECDFGGIAPRPGQTGVCSFIRRCGINLPLCHENEECDFGVARPPPGQTGVCHPKRRCGLSGSHLLKCREHEDCFFGDVIAPGELGVCVPEFLI